MNNEQQRQKLHRVLRQIKRAERQQKKDSQKLSLLLRRFKKSA